MRIAFYTPFVPPSAPRPSGDRTQARNLLLALDKQGHQVCDLCGFRSKRFWLEWSKWCQLPSALWRTFRQARMFRPEVWFTFVSEREVPDLFGPILSSWLGIPYVIYKAPFRGVYRALRRKEGPVRALWFVLPGYLLNLLALSAADWVIVNKAGDYDCYIRHPRLRRKLHLLWPAVCSAAFFPSADERVQMRRQLNIPEQRCVLLSVSRLSDKAGRKAASIHFLIDCVGDLLKSRRDIHLLIVGDGTTRAELETHARELGNAVSFAGTVEHDQVRAWYNAADVFAFPGLGEYVGMVYLEAQACGLPVVAFNNGGIPNVVRDGETGFLVKPRDRAEFVRALEQLITDEGLRHEMGRTGRKHILTRHELDTWGVSLCSFLKKRARGYQQSAFGFQPLANGR
jgi:glycosyltransferase involved in cell wall biosynthesis